MAALQVIVKKQLRNQLASAMHAQFPSILFDIYATAAWKTWRSKGSQQQKKQVGI